MIRLLQSRTVMTGFAIFAMFFGAGNVVYPLTLGQYAKDSSWIGVLGFLLTDVGVLILGLISMGLFGGNYRQFFGRIGKVPGAWMAAFIMILIGPLGAMPRTIALAYSTTHLFLPSLSLPIFSALSCVLLYVLTYRKSSIVDIIGKILTPILLLSLFIIIVKGIWLGPELGMQTDSSWTVFFRGLSEGYQTMDLLGAFFFSSVIIASLKEAAAEEGVTNQKGLIRLTVKSSAIGGVLLALVYIGFTYVGAFWSDALAQTRQDYYLGSLAILLLGNYGGIVACIAVAFACLTTAMALAAVSSEFLHHSVFKNRISYAYSLVITLVINYFVSTLEFTGIMEFLAPILEVCYPALILLSLLNISYKLWGVQSVKLPTLIVFCISLYGNLA